MQSADDKIVEESPEQVLARLERYRESLRRGARGSLGASRAQAPLAIAFPKPMGKLTGDEFLPACGRARVASASSSSVLWNELRGVTLAAVVFWSFVILSSHFGTKLAEGGGLALAATGAFGALRRIPLSAWCLVGVVLGAAVVHLS